jgi:Zn-finger nucleic acid-binding protein
MKHGRGEWKFPSEVLYRVLETVEEGGFCVLGQEEIDRLLSRIEGGHVARRQALEEFAQLSGLKMETTPNLNAARFEHPIPEKTMNLTLHSPVADAMMHLSEIEPGLCAYTCPESGGVWIPLQSFLDWKEQHGHDVFKMPVGYVPELSDDTKRRALICPESGYLLIRYRVGHGLPFYVDVSPKTGGIWLDRGEWDALKSKELHIELNHIFTAPYQERVRSEEREEVLEGVFRERIGEEDFDKVVELKEWLRNHPKRREIRCYLFHDLKYEEE